VWRTSIIPTSSPERCVLISEEDQVGARILLSHSDDQRGEHVDAVHAMGETSVEEVDQVEDRDALLRNGSPDLVEGQWRRVQGCLASGGTPCTTHEDPVVHVVGSASDSTSDALRSERDGGLGGGGGGIAIGVLHSRSLSGSDLGEDQPSDRILRSQGLDVDQESLVAPAGPDARDEQLEELGKHDAVIQDRGSHLLKGRLNDRLRDRDEHLQGDAPSVPDENAVVGILGGASGGGGNALPSVRGDRGVVGAEGVLHGESGEGGLGCWGVVEGDPSSFNRDVGCVNGGEGESDGERDYHSKVQRDRFILQ